MPTAPLSQATIDAAATGGPAAPVAQILSLGSYLPAGVLTNADMEAMVETSDTWIMERTGIRERHRVAPDETPSSMGARAAADALQAAGNPVPDAIIVATCSAETRLPSTACLIQRRLGLGGMAAFDINAACSGFIYALSIADAMIRARAVRTVLVVASEALTTLVDYTDRGTCVLFGDGAAAAVVGAGEDGGIRAIRLAADGADADLIYFGTQPGDEGGKEAIRMAGRGTFRSAVLRLTDIALEVCADAGWAGDEVDWFIPHQANLRIIEAAAKRVGVPMERVIVNVDRVGNTSAASIPIALHEAAAAGRLKPGQRIVSVAFGSGITWGGMAFEWTGTPTR
jgi:3-oxoacyl-[acyl-carrier-protein] synthase III